MPNSVYFEKYNKLLEVLMNQGVDLGCEPGTLKNELNALKLPVDTIADATADELEEAKVQVRAKYIDMTFLSTVDRKKYRKLLEDLEKSAYPRIHRCIFHKYYGSIPYPYSLVL